MVTQTSLSIFGEIWGAESESKFFLYHVRILNYSNIFIQKFIQMTLILKQFLKVKLFCGPPIY